MIRVLSVLLSFFVLTGVLRAQPPKLGDDESFESFCERWNEWVESLPPDEIIIDRLRDIRDQNNSPYNLEIDSYYAVDIIEAKPGGYGWHLTPRVYEDHREYFEQLDEVARRSYLGGAFPEPDTGFGEIPLSPAGVIGDREIELGWMLSYLCRDLMNWGRYLAHNEDMDAAIERFERVVQLCDRFEEMPTIGNYFYQSAAGSMLSEILMDLVELSEVLGISDQQLAEIQQLLPHIGYAPLRPMIEFDNRITELNWRANAVDGVFDPAFEKEYRELAQGMMFRIFASDSPVMPDLDPQSTVPFAPLDEQFERVQAIADALFADLDAFPADQSVCRVSAELVKQFNDDQDGNRFIPAYIHTLRLRTMLDIQLNARYKLRNNLVITAIHRYRVRNGDWPQTLDELDDEILPVPAIDLYSGAPLRYSKGVRSPRLWALGIDRDDDLSRRNAGKKDDEEFKLRHSWIAIEEWEALSDEQRAHYNGDIKLMQ